MRGLGGWGQTDGIDRGMGPRSSFIFVIIVRVLKVIPRQSINLLLLLPGNKKEYIQKLSQEIRFAD